MNISAHTIQKNYTQDLLNILTDKCRTYVAPLTTSLSSFEYGQLISSLSDALAYISRDALKATFEEMNLISVSLIPKTMKLLLNFKE